MLRHQLGVGNIGIERPDQVIAILEGVGDEKVGLVASRFGVVHQVHPMPGPAFAESGRCQQAVHHQSMGIGSLVVDEPLNLLRSGRQARQGEGKAAQPRPPVRGWSGSQTLSFEFDQQKPVDGIPGPAAVPGGGGRMAAWGFPNPGVSLLACRKVERFGGASGKWSRLRIGPGGSGFNPGSYVLDDRCRKRSWRRHLQMRVPVGDGLVKSTLERLAGHHHRPRHTTLDHGVPGVQPEARFLPLGTVAGGAMGDQNRTNSLLEEFSIGFPGNASPSREGQQR